MERNALRRALTVAATHAAKQSIELVEAVSKVSERVPAIGSYDVDVTWARGNIAAIRRELDDLEHLLEGREPPIPVAPRSEAA